jgi:hypothetical protein
LDIIVFKLDKEISRSGMIEDISQKSDRLFKGKILVLKLMFEEVTKGERSFDKFSDSRKDAFECTDFSQVAVNIPLVRMRVE